MQTTCHTCGGDSDCPDCDPPDGPPAIGDGPGEDNPPPECTACRTNDYVMSSTHPGLCLGCANARYWGFQSRLEAEPLAWVLPVPVLYCPSCLCVAEQIAPDAWRCRGCLSPWRVDDLLTTSELIKRRAALERIHVAVLERLTCRNCGGMHQTWRCPEIHQALFAEPRWTDIALGREIWRMRWKDFPAFVALLWSATGETLRTYAASYVAFVQSFNAESTLTVDQVLTVWQRHLTPSPAAPAMMRAA